ncbi:hypothetical protein [Microbacterium sp.]|uniref:hypothetical protein n=1 Tax=Microbacterium sp. TaxID=51671 RepID=UPI0039E61420
MDDAQTWAVIGVLAASFLGTMTIISTMFTRVIKTEIGAVRRELSAAIGGVRAELGAEIGGLREEMNARFQAVHTRLDGMDRDIQLLMNREFGTDRG